MSIILFPHNQAAYDSALRMMGETGKAAVVHPTGTGKSFIGFKLAEQHPDKKICWLSPSEYIFKTQVENLKAVTNGYVPENIEFMTYAKLMITDGDYIKGMGPGYIVLDEFHRCGAAEWGKGVKRLLDAYPDAPLLGLSATNIRYLDDQRDMADELFDSNVASEITLGEAIVRNIILPPTYITSVYSYQKDLEKYQRKVRSAKNIVVRDSAQKYLDALRRALTQAEGLDVIFDKHIKDRHGKFIVFCANLEHMQEMKARIPEWFGRIDSAPHIYTVYAEEPSSEKEFKAFKQDGSAHLKLLFCIDMLNEGVHVEDVSGVILFRPTISPIIYKQQIGRALSAAKCKDPVIFDIVNNFENLYSLGSIEEEMREAIERCRENGEAEKIVNSAFHVIDEVRDCRRLFDELNDTLTATWDAFYTAAKAYFAEYGHLDIPTTYRYQKLALGKWIYAQRRIRKGETNGIISDERIQKLDSIGMIWTQRSDIPWNRGIEHAKAYRDTYGDLMVPVNYVSPDGYNLGGWITTMRCTKRSKERRGQLSDEKIKQLDDLGMVWNKFDFSFEQHYAEAERYYRENGNLLIPVSYFSPNNLALGRWIHSMRGALRGNNKATLNEERIRRLDMIGMQWDYVLEDRWEKGFAEASQYFSQFKTLNVSTAAKTESGFPLGQWLYTQKLAYIGYKGRKRLAPEKARRLEGIGIVWDVLANNDSSKRAFQKHQTIAQRV